VFRRPAHEAVRNTARRATCVGLLLAAAACKPPLGPGSRPVSRLYVGIIDYRPSNPNAHRQQARAIPVPQDAQARPRVGCNVCVIDGIVMNPDDAAGEGPSRHAVDEAPDRLRPASRASDHFNCAPEEDLALVEVRFRWDRCRRRGRDRRGVGRAQRVGRCRACRLGFGRRQRNIRPNQQRPVAVRAQKPGLLVAGHQRGAVQLRRTRSQFCSARNTTHYIRTHASDSFSS
jgi:hypothetical protein